MFKMWIAQAWVGPNLLWGTEPKPEFWAVVAVGANDAKTVGVENVENDADDQRRRFQSYPKKWISLVPHILHSRFLIIIENYFTLVPNISH